MSDDLYQNIILPKLNFSNYSKEGKYCEGQSYFNDKNYQEFFVDIASPKCVLHNVDGVLYDNLFNRISVDSALLLLEKYDKLVYKKSTETGHGKDVFLINKSDYSRLIGTKDYIIQEVLQQHDSLSCYNISSVNVIRITSLFWKGNIYILGGVLRIGAPGSFCDLVSTEGKYPLIVPILENGELGNRAIDCDRGYVYDDIRGKKIGKCILKYAEMQELVKREHQKYPKHGIIGWDLTLDKYEDIRCIEYNVDCPGIMQTQYALGAIFAKKSVGGSALLDEILETE